MVLHAGESRTKIVCTLGPACQAPETLRSMVREGMDVARVNLSHGSHAENSARIAAVRQAAEAEGATIAVLADLQGPKFRIGDLARPLDLKDGDPIRFTPRPADGTDRVVPLPHPELIAEASVGDHLVLDDGGIEVVVREVHPDMLIGEVLSGGRLSSRKGIAVPGGGRTLPSLTEKDRADVAYAVDQGADFVALSFVRRAADLEELRGLLDAHGPHGAETAIVAKIEKAEALRRFEEIVRAADAIMVARGDLGIEISPQEVPLHQKEIIRRCNHLGVPVITATQMLQSMVEDPRPTRAEASDVANAILDGTDAVMLSGETAIGRYPTAAVAMMRKISEIVECRMPPRNSSPDEIRPIHPITAAIGRATVSIADAVDARLIATSTWSGYTARQIARMRPQRPIVAFTPREPTVRQLALSWGVTPILVPPYGGTDDMLATISRTIVERGFVSSGDLIVVTGGLPLGGGGRTNFIQVHRVGEAD